MKNISQEVKALLMLVCVASIAMFIIACDEDDNNKQQGSDSQTTIENWPAVSKEVAQTMIDKYGEPNGITPDMLVWNNSGPWKRTIVSRETTDHNFPTPHPDLLEQFINYQVPAEMFDDMAMYDGSVIVERTKGEISARCDKEGANFLAINLASEVATGVKTVAEAREFYTQTMTNFMAGQSSPYMAGFLFTPPTGATGDPDVKTIN